MLSWPICRPFWPGFGRLPEPGVFAALADPTRRQLIDWLTTEESGTATGFAERLPMSRQAVARHLRELEDAGIVESTRSGRETRYSLVTAPLDDAATWLAARARTWDRSLGRLREQIESTGRGSLSRLTPWMNLSSPVLSVLSVRPSNPGSSTTSPGSDNLCPEPGPSMTTCGGSGSG